MALQKFKQTEIGKIPEDWKVIELRKLLIGSVKHGIYKSKEFYTDTGVKLLKMGVQYGNDKIGDQEMERVLVTDEEIERFGINEGDLIFSRTSMMSDGAGNCSLVVHHKEPIVFDGNLLCAELNRNFACPEFYFYFFKSKVAKHEIAKITTGTQSRNIAGSNLMKVITPFPPLSEQQSIARILSSLDSKIEFNNKMNQTLEAIGQVLFKKWFVDNPEKENWKEGKLGDLGDFKNGINYLRNETGDTEFSIINVRDISNNKRLLKESLDKINIDLEKAKEYLLDEKDIIIARSACPGKISLLLGDTDGIIFSGFSIRYRLKDLRNYFYVSFILENLKEELRNYSVGTTLSSVNQETLKNFNVVLPDEYPLQSFNKIIQPIFEQISVNCFQSQKLSQIRDVLLPKLINGEVRVTPKDGK